MVDSENEDSLGGWKRNSSSGESSSLKDHDRLLPIANVGRIMKKILPANAKISKDAKETVQECVSEFISFITGEASDKCQRERRKTINGDDLLWAMTTLGFEEYVEPLKVYLQRFRDLEGEKNATTMGSRQGGGGGDVELGIGCGEGDMYETETETGRPNNIMMTMMMMGHEMNNHGQQIGSYRHHLDSDGNTNPVLYSTGSASSAPPLND